ncbi:hypothetical protein ACOMHN_008738 [Nucella lapillus]
MEDSHCGGLAGIDPDPAVCPHHVSTFNRSPHRHACHCCAVTSCTARVSMSPPPYRYIRLVSHRGEKLEIRVVPADPRGTRLMSLAFKENRLQDDMTKTNGTKEKAPCSLCGSEQG